MRKYLLPFFVFLIIHVNGYSQDFLGISTGNFGGVTGVLLQPASIVDSRHKFDINLFSTGVRYSNNYFLVDRDVILKFNKNNFKDYASFKANYLSAANLPAGEKVFFNITNRTQLPLSFMATLSKKSAIAVNFQSRSMIQGRNISQDIAQMSYNGFFHPPLNNQPLDASGFTMDALNWVEAGFTYGRVLYNNDRHFLKAAVTAKYLGGIASFSAGSNNLQVSVNNDSSVNFNTSNFQYNHNKNADFDMVFDKNFRPDANAFGLDAGLVYEYRGNLSNFKYIKNDDEESYVADRRDVNKYIFKLGVSLLDAGRFTFEKPGNVNSFSANIADWDIRNANYNSIREFDTALANRVTANANDPREYNVYLPAALSVQMDIRFVKGLFLNAMAYRPLKMGAESGKRFNNYGYYTITPRWERRHFGIYIPYTFSDKNEITNYRENRLGATIRVGSFFLGSSNLGTMAFNKNLKAADVHLGLKVGITYGKPTKASRLFNARFKDDANAPVFLPGASLQRVADTVFASPAGTNKLLVDYSKGQVYSDGKKEGNVIIINNNYYYGNNTLPARDTLIVQQQYRLMNRDSIYYTSDSLRISQLYQLRKSDSLQQSIQDSIQLKKMQLDSLIKDLQLLRIEMDKKESANKPGALNLPMDSNKSTLDNPFSDQLQRNYNASQQGIIQSSDTALAHQAAATVSAGVGNGQGPDYTDSKKKSKVGTREIIKTGDKGAYRRQDTVVIQSIALQQAPPVVINTGNDNERNRNRREQNDQFNRYVRETRNLKTAIAGLENRLEAERKRSTRTDNSYSLPVATNISSNVPSYQQPTLRDTVYIKDTIRIRDTLEVVKIETPPTVTSPRPQTIYVPVEKETIIREKIDYTLMPEEVLLFDIGKAAIRKTYFSKLDYIAGILLKNPGLSVEITGHTDVTGPPRVNEQLSLKRAATVKNYLVAQGIPENRLTLTAMSNIRPVVEGNTTAANSQNRRVVVKIVAGRKG